MANPGDFAYTVKQQVDIVRVVGDYIRLKKAGAQNYSGLCPFHNEKSPSFNVHATRQFFHCFGCGASGDVFSFVQKIENITFPEAVRAVAQKAGIPLPKATYSGPEEAKEARERGQLIDLHERACAFFEEQLRRPEGARAREYLAGRGLGDEHIRRFRIGFAPESGFLLRDALKTSFEIEILKLSGLLSWKDDGDKSALYSKFRNRVIFPICNENGKVIAFTGRTLATDDKSGPKYLNSPETPIYTKGRVLFNLHLAKEAIRKLDYAIVVEGQMDCLSVFIAGFHNVIASSGTAFTETQARLLGRFSKKVVLNFDPDTAGAAAAERTLGLLVAEEFDIKVVTLDQGFDPDLYIRRLGAAAYGEALKKSPRYFDWLIERARAQFPARDPNHKVKAVNFLLPHIQRVPSRIIRDELSADIAQKLGIDSAVLRQELRHAAGTRAGTVHAPAEAPVTEAEKILIRAAAAPRAGTLPDEFDVRRQAHFFLATDQPHRGLPSESLLQRLVEGGEEFDDPMALPLSDAERRLLAQSLLDEGEELTAELLEGAVNALRRRKLERELGDLQARLNRAQTAHDSLELARLGQEKIKIKQALDLL